mmetsp:Transcript_49613/g.57148  ORF Transcript_49613/g.57148 Transcript_49613/m.57148 type:complete len:83 (-) Transcript_49613:781-1029(-)
MSHLFCKGLSIANVTDPTGHVYEATQRRAMGLYARRFKGYICSGSHRLKFKSNETPTFHFRRKTRVACSGGGSVDIIRRVEA